MLKVLTAEQMREVDRLTTERYGIPSIILMENAAHAVARVITERLGGSVKGKSILILCGKGNNGGDGAALARVLWTQGANITFCLMFEDDEFKGDARENLRLLRQLQDAQIPFEEPSISSAEVGTHRIFFDSLDPFLGPDLVVDAVFGTGLIRPLNNELDSLAMQYNALFNEPTRPIYLSVDLPSGIDADLSMPPGRCFSADVTVTFTAPKAGNILPSASRSNGEVVIANIGSPQRLIDEQPSQLYLAEKSDAVKWLSSSAFSVDSYKNKRGHALVVAGSEDYSGAAVLAGNSAMRSGVGLVTLAVPSAIRSEVAARALPDLIVRAFDDDEFDVKADATLIGCGLDANLAANEVMFRKIVADRTSPVIVDAGALGFLSQLNTGSVQPPATAGGSDLILTPHEGEFLRLLGSNDKDAIKDRVTAVREYATANNVILVLKGERVLIGSPDGRVVVNPTGNSGLGKAGNGDTLAGILVGFVAQAVKMDIDIFETVVAAVYIAGMAGDVAEEKYGKRVMTASDVRECLSEVFAEFSV